MTVSESVYDFAAETLEGRPAPLSDYRGKVLLIVNTASKCGFTPQYAGLEALWKKYRDQGLMVLGFPCNQFGNQEPGDSAEIANFCALTYDVSFPLMAKIHVNGPEAHPLYAFLKRQKKGVLGSESVKWNFTKFLIGRDGAVLGRFSPTVEPKDLERAVEAAL
jgi:glutathione peroxidase